MKQDADRTTEPQQRRSRRTRAELLAAVERVVAAEGPDAVTTTRIATETGVAVGTIYRYFADREALLLAAYDETVVRILAACNEALGSFDARFAPAEAASRLLHHYLDAAEAIPAHAGLLRAMRTIRSVAAEIAVHEEEIERDILAPFLARFLPEADLPPMSIAMVNATVGTLVDLYLVSESQTERDWLRGEIEAYLAFVVARLI
ncbi:MAG: hypothetical protein Rhirs2KO_11890 [Rhizobiaceae bacterium]